jgi:hypothetical protein
VLELIASPPLIPILLGLVVALGVLWSSAPGSQIHAR